jgi:hypothetical protein
MFALWGELRLLSYRKNQKVNVNENPNNFARMRIAAFNQQHHLGAANTAQNLPPQLARIFLRSLWPQGRGGSSPLNRICISGKELRMDKWKDPPDKVEPSSPSKLKTVWQYAAGVFSLFIAMFVVSVANEFFFPKPNKDHQRQVQKKQIDQFIKQMHDRKTYSK